MAPKAKKSSKLHRLGSKLRHPWNVRANVSESAHENSPGTSAQSLPQSRSASTTPNVKVPSEIERLDTSGSVYLNQGQGEVASEEVEKLGLAPMISATTSEGERLPGSTSNLATGTNTNLPIISTASEVAKTCLRFLKESSDAFPPLKSIVGGISFFVDNHEKWGANKETLQSLTMRVSQLTKGLYQIEVSSQTVTLAEKEGRENLEKDLAQIAKDLEDLKNGNRVLKYLTSNNESGTLTRIIEAINTIILDYQFYVQKEIYKHFLSLMDSGNVMFCSRYARILMAISSADMAVLDRLPRVKDAWYQSREVNTGCFPGTRVDVLNQLEDWVSNGAPGGQHVYWLNGHAGSGKSTIAHTFCQRLYANGQLGASFFCSRDFLDRSNIRLIFPTLAFQLAFRYPSFRTPLLETLKQRPDIGSESMITQLTELLVNPLKESSIRTTISIDALDEAKDQEPASTILSLLARVIDQIPLVNFFVTGRPEHSIRAGFRVPALKPHTEIMILHELEHSNVERDISLYIHSSLSNVVHNRSRFNVSQPWPSVEQVNILVAKSAGYFIFAATCVKMISSPPPSDPVEVLEALTGSMSTTLEGKNGIDDLYTYVLTNYSQSSTIDIHAQLRSILGAIILLYQPLSSSALSGILNILPSRLEARLGGLHSLLSVPPTDSGYVRIHHKSFPDYLTDHVRCSNDGFYIDPSAYHAELAIVCLTYMKKKLRKNICSLPRYAMNSVLPLVKRREHIGESLEYACQFWPQHVCAAAHSGEHVGRLLPVLCEFLMERQVLWFEVLSLLDDIHNSISSLQHLENWLLKIQKSDNTVLALRWVEDGLLLVLRFVDCIQNSASHLYHSALLLAPKPSLLRNTHTDDLLSEGALLQGSECWDTQRAIAINVSSRFGLESAFSPNGELFATVSDWAMEVFEVMSGKRLYKMIPNKVKKYSQFRVKFLQDASMILLGYENRLEVWDLPTGCVIHSYHGLEATGHVNIVDISLDQYYIACGFSDGDSRFVRVWERDSETLVYNITIAGGARLISFSQSHNSLLVCSDGPIQQRNIQEDSFTTFGWAQSNDDFTISDNRSLLAVTSTPGIKEDRYITLYDTHTGCVIWEQRWFTALHICTICPNQQSLWILSKLSLEVFDYTTGLAEVLREHHLESPYFTLCSKMTSNSLCVAYNQNGLFIRHIPTTQFKGSTQSSKDGLNFCTTEDRTMAVMWHPNSRHFRVWGPAKDVSLLATDESFRDNRIFHASLTSNREFMAITLGLGAEVWDLDTATLACKIKGFYHNFPRLSFIDDNTFLIVSNEDLSRISGVNSGFTANETSLKSVSGIAGSSWNVHILPIVHSIKFRASEIEGQTEYHLDLTAYFSANTFPRGPARPLDSEGWLTDRNDNKILWVPHDSRELVWTSSKVFATGSQGGVIFVIDFSNVRDAEMNDPSAIRTKQQAKVAKYVKNLKEIPWFDEPETPYDDESINSSE